MQLKKISRELIANLIKKEELKLPASKPVFTVEEHKKFRASIRNNEREVWMRDRRFVVRYFMHRNEEWVTIRPEKGFAPMFSGEKEKVLNTQTEI